MSVDVPSADALKRLEFVKSYSTYITTAVDTADKVYKSGRTYTPKFLEPYVTGLEERVVAYAAPVVTAVQDRADKALRTADTQLDSGLGQLWSSYDGGRSYVLDKASAATSTQAKAKESVLKVVDQAVDVLAKQRATLSAAAGSAADSVKAAVEHARSTTEQNTQLALEKVASTWEYLLSFPAVVKLLEASSPALDFAKPYYTSAHHTVTANPGYKYVYNVSKGVIESVQENTLYKKGEEMLYPLIAPVAAPVLKKVVESPLYQQVVEELKPTNATAKATPPAAAPAVAPTVDAMST